MNWLFNRVTSPGLVDTSIGDIHIFNFKKNLYIDNDVKIEKVAFYYFHIGLKKISNLMKSKTKT